MTQRWTPPIPRAFAWPVALGVGVLMGALEGAIYSPPRGYEHAYWTLLVITLMGFLAPYIGFTRALAFLPFVVVVQDAVSLLAQGASPLTATWYAAFFGDNVLTQRAWMLPNWYWIATGATLVLEGARCLACPKPQVLKARRTLRRAERSTGSFRNASRPRERERDLPTSTGPRGSS